MSDDTTLGEFASTKEKNSDETERSELIQGVAWSVIDSVPEGWVVNNIESDIDILSGNNFSSEYFAEDGGIPLIRIRDLAEGETTINFDGEYDSKYLIDENDLLVGMDGEFEPHLWAGRQALLNQRVCKIEPRSKYNKIFFRYAIEKPLFYIQKSIAGTTVKHLSQSNINDLNLPTPPLSEQRKIATVLHTVDQAIQKSEEIVDQLRRTKRGVAQKLFTQGVLEHSCYTDSIVGEFPQEWDIDRLGKLVDLRNGLNFSSDQKGSGTLLANVTNIYGTIEIEPSELSRVSISKKEIEKYKLNKGDIITARSSKSSEGVGQVAIYRDSNEPVVFAGFTIRQRPDHELIYPEYLVQYLRYPETRKRVVALGGEMAITNISQADLGKVEIPVPSMREQQKIAEVLRDYDRSISIEKKHIQQLRSIKQGLMQDLLSGKVRAIDAEIDITEEIAKYD